ncbi:hypothetical protein [Bacillus sp. P14.5]|uniref:hypothetical protein n=1 Tax=Bacillus sp. P14.5 TaxID=1983400 RepID=UPI0013B056D7|nr:hypothetical protein [Bacillus sp. P14.5]
MANSSQPFFLTNSQAIFISDWYFSLSSSFFPISSSDLALSPGGGEQAIKAKHKAVIAKPIVILLIVRPLPINLHLED